MKAPEVQVVQVALSGLAGRQLPAALVKLEPGQLHCGAAGMPQINLLGFSTQG